MRKIPQIKGVCVSRIVFPKASILDVKCREVCILRVKYQNFSLCIDVVDAKDYQSRNSISTFDVCVLVFFFFLSVSFSSSLLSIFGGCSHPCTKTYYSFYNAMKCSSLDVLHVREKYHSENHDNPDNSRSSESKKREANPDFYVYLRLFPGPSFHPPRPESDQSIHHMENYSLRNITTKYQEISNISSLK
jgi:hypothetical protein